jgi:hypothetical protein
VIVLIFGYCKTTENIAVQKERLEILQKMIRTEFPKEAILGLGFTEDEYAKAEAELFQME